MMTWSKRKKIQKPLNEIVVPHFTFPSSDYVEGLSRESCPIISWKLIPESFPATWKTCQNRVYIHSSRQRNWQWIFCPSGQSSSCFSSILVFLTYSVCVAACKKPVWCCNICYPRILTSCDRIILLWKSVWSGLQSRCLMLSKNWN